MLKRVYNREEEMLKIGDKVRYRNQYLTGIGKRHGRSRIKCRRGEQRVMTVIDIGRGKWDWRTKKYSGDLVLVDCPLDNLHPFSWINAHWLKFVRRGT